ncbi:hypothetical protein MTP99_016782 [Tenebrio molitor]|nr:hypothetical protein MTP99_016782 [Tenebrio molitor]
MFINRLIIEFLMQHANRAPFTTHRKCTQGETNLNHDELGRAGGRLRRSLAASTCEETTEGSRLGELRGDYD